jgi:hypothetical protein
MNMERLDISIWDVEEAGGVVLHDSNFNDCKMSTTPPSDPDCERDEGGYNNVDEYDYSYTLDEEKEIKLAIKRSRRDIEYILKHHNFQHHKANVLMKLIEHLEKDIYNIQYLDVFNNTVSKKRQRNEWCE